MSSMVRDATGGVSARVEDVSARLFDLRHSRVAVRLDDLRGDCEHLRGSLRRDDSTVDGLTLHRETVAALAEIAIAETTEALPAWATTGGGA